MPYTVNAFNEVKAQSNTFQVYRLGLVYPYSYYTAYGRILQSNFLIFLYAFPLPFAFAFENEDRLL